MRKLKKTWVCSVLVESHFNCMEQEKFEFNGNLKSAYIHTAIKALKWSWRFPKEDFGVRFRIIEKTN